MLAHFGRNRAAKYGLNVTIAGACSEFSADVGQSARRRDSRFPRAFVRGSQPGLGVAPSYLRRAACGELSASAPDV
jgi:hypothetical protein